MLKFIFNSNSWSVSRSVPSEYKGDLYVSSRNENFLPPLSMTHIEYCQESCTVKLTSAIGNPVPLFWGWHGESLIVSDSPVRIMEHLKPGGAVTSDLDKVGYIESILFDGPLGDRTFFERVKKVQSAETVTIDVRNYVVRKEWRWLPNLQTNCTISESDAHEQAVDQIKNLLGDLQIPEEGIVLPITGGLDSRLLAALVRERSNAPIYSYTFQRGWSFESWCSKKVASALYAEHNILELDEKCYREFSRKSAKLSGGFISGMHTHGIYCCEELLPTAVKHLPRMFGFLGEHVTGAMTDTLVDGTGLSTPHAILKKYEKCLFPGLVERFKEDILNDLEDTYRAFKLSSSPDHCFHEFWRIQQRQNNLITHLFHYHRCHHSVRVIEPFVNPEFIDFFLSLPLRLRFNRSLFKNVTNHIFPKIFSLPSMHYTKDSYFAKAESLCEMLESLFNKINIRQEIFLSPFKYEQHEKNLQNYLGDDVVKGASLMKEVFGVDPVGIKYPLWLQGSSVKEHYRLAMLSHLFSC